MKRLIGLFIALFSLKSGILSYAEEDYVIYDGNKLTAGYDLGVDSSEHIFEWFKHQGDEFEICYPEGQDWGAVFITVGPPAYIDERRTEDFFTFDILEISMKGDKRNETVEIGIKEKQIQTTDQKQNL